MEYRHIQHKNGTLTNEHVVLPWRGYTIDKTHTTTDNQWTLPLSFPDTLPPQYHNATISDHWKQLFHAAPWLFTPNSQQETDSANHLDSVHQISPSYGDLSCTQNTAFGSLLHASGPSLDAVSPITATPHTAFPITPSDEAQWSPPAIFGTATTAGQLISCDDIKMESEPLSGCFEAQTAPPQDSDSLDRVLADQNITVHKDQVVPGQPWQPGTLIPHQDQGPNHTARPPQPPVYGCTAPVDMTTTLPSSLAGIQVQYLSESELKKNDLRRRNRMAASKARGLRKEVAKHESFGDLLVC
ncbi:hypothetical protein PspLS_04279 [Pyricularia sp. CBS 133598]|nr:hypothetical protein PspLS_04279 [Pyricularia sp. CBS 133598]